MKRTIGALVLTISCLSISIAVVACSSSSSTATDTTDASTPISRGEALVVANGCSGGTCHGADLGGNVKQSSGVYSANITFDTSKDMSGIAGWTTTDLSNALLKSTDDQGDSICSDMPKFPDFTAQNISDIYAYLKSMPPVDRAQTDTDCKGNVPDGG